MSDEPSEWQKKIEGRWYGRPSLFDATGNHVGFEYVDRASVFEDGVTTYYMDTRLEGSGPLRNRFELGAQFAFGVMDSDQNRIYTGPDFHGTGQPYGTFVAANYYSPGWQADLLTWNQILDGDTQVYSSVLHDGWSVCAVFNGVYKVAHDYDTNLETKARIDQWIGDETSRGPKPQVLPTKQAGVWSGTFETVDALTREVLEPTQVTITHTPITLRRWRHDVVWEGPLTRSYSYEATRDGARTQYEGPDIWGNASTYGRALYTTQHAAQKDWKIRGREYLMDSSLELANVWELRTGDALSHVLHGRLRWDAR